MSLKSYYENKQKAKELFKLGIEIKQNNENLPLWKLNTKLNKIISEMSFLGYKTTIEEIGYKSEGGKVYEDTDLKLIHMFTEVLKLKTTSLGFANYWTIYNKLAQMECGETCRYCKGSGDYRLSSGVMTGCARCNGTGIIVELSESLLEDLKQHN